MKESIRCCISCMLPCGALDAIRIVHASGRLEVISRRSVFAADIMQAYPKHVLRQPSSGVCPPAAVVLPPGAELQRGKIYFLAPVSSSAVAAAGDKSVQPAAAGLPSRRRKKRGDEGNGVTDEDRERLLMTDRYLSELLSESKVTASAKRERRRGRVGVWRPHLESIFEENANEVV